MEKQAGRKIRLLTTVYWMLLTYIVAALVWWFISLEKQNKEMRDLLLISINSGSSTLSGQEKHQLTSSVYSQYHRNNTKYLAEGVTFLILILIGASFVYRSVRKQFKLQQQQQNFMMAVTHELKTPISVAKLNLETMQKYHLDTEKQLKLIRMTLQETSRLNGLINNILVSSQLEGGGYLFSREELDFSSLVKDCIREAQNRFPERNFLDEVISEIEITGDPLLLQMMINNLLENAVKYSPKEKPITCRLQKDNNHILLNIIDEGSGIAENEKKKVFEKFYRTGDEATRKTQGTGLGLYLCRKIAEDHNADIGVTNNTPSGSNFAITFYK